MATVNFIIRLMDQPIDITVNFNEYNFSVHTKDGIIADGYFTGRKKDEDCIAFWGRPEVSLFEDLLRAKVVREMKKSKEAWKQMKEYQHKKAWS